MIKTLHATEVLLHLAASPAFFDRHAGLVSLAGGSASNIRGDVVTRYVRLPLPGNEALVDELVRAYPTKRSTGIKISRVEAEGADPARLNAAFDRGGGVLRYPTGSGEELGAFIAEGLAAMADLVDWGPELERWARQEHRDADAERRAALDAALEAGRAAIADEALRLLDGEGDLDRILDLARAYRETRVEAGLEPEPTAAPAMG